MTYNTVSDMIADITLGIGDIVNTLGFYEKWDNGGAVYTIVGSQLFPWSIELDNGVYATISNTDMVTYRMFGARLDGRHDDGQYLRWCHQYADSHYTYDDEHHYKHYTCRVENHDGIIYKKDPDSIMCCSDVDLSGSTLIMDDTNAGWFGFYVWGDSESLYFDYELKEEQIAELKMDQFYFPELVKDISNRLPNNVILCLSEAPYCARDDAGYLYTVGRKELLVHDCDGICHPPLTNDWDNAGGQEINCEITDYDDHSKTFNSQSSSILQATYSYITDQHGTFTGCRVLLNMSDDKYNSVFWCKRNNATVQNWTMLPDSSKMHNTRFKNSMIYLWHSYNVTVRGIQAFDNAGKRDDQGHEATSGYVLRLTNCLDVHVEDCRMQGYWGCTAMDSVKNIHFLRCHMNRLDIHDYYSNLYARDCTFYNHAIQIGFGRGVSNFTNCSFFYNDIPKDNYPSSHLLEFDLTYARSFEGQITIEGCKVIVHNAADGEYNLIKMAFSNGGVSVIPHFQLPDIYVNNLNIQSDNPNIVWNLINVSGVRTAQTGIQPPTHIYGQCADNDIIWEYYGRSQDFGDNTKQFIKQDIVLRVFKTFKTEDGSTQFYDYKYYLCTSEGTLDFDHTITDVSGNEFTCGTAKLKYVPDILWQSKHKYKVGELCAASNSRWYDMSLFKCIKAGTSEGYFPTHTSGIVLDGINDSVNEPDACWWEYVQPKAGFCIDFVPNMAVNTGKIILAEGRIYKVVTSGSLLVTPPYDTTWMGISTSGTAELQFLGLVWQPKQWYALNSYCIAGPNVYKLVKHSGSTSGKIPQRGNPYCIDGGVIWKSMEG